MLDVYLYKYKTYLNIYDHTSDTLKYKEMLIVMTLPANMDNLYNSDSCVL